ncbi:MAG: DNA topoisomerase 3 [Bacteroidales bacterium]
MKLCIAEKPSVAREIANVLGAKSRRDGYYEGNGFQVSWTFGHLCTLKSPEDYTSIWKRWSLNSLPMIPERFGIKVIPDIGVQKQFDVLERLISSCSEVINCGDAGIEGELIQRWVLVKAKCNKKVKRLWISSLTEEAIKEGFSKLKDASDFDLLYAAGNARAIGDWLLGMNASRLYTLKFANNKGVLSIGRVQTPTLAMIVQRFLEIKNFKPEKYWELKTVYRETLFSSKKGKFKTVNEGKEMLEAVKDHDFTIVSSTKKKGKEAPLRLFDLTSLQVECNKKYSLSADETLKVIQALYEKKLVTYPRVDTTYLPDDIYPKIPSVLKGLVNYANLTGKLLSAKIRKSKKVFDDSKVTDHHAIIPTGVKAMGMSLYEEKVYDSISRRFISVFYPDCIVSNTVVIGESNSVEFKATGKEILEYGWREVYMSTDREASIEKAKDDKDQIMPSFVKGESGPHKPELMEKETLPPKLYTEATLLRMMETAGKHVDNDELRDALKENGIGRPSTRAAVIETLFRRKYIRKIRKSLEPTTTGVQLIEKIKDPLLKSVELTGQWERKLRLIEKENYSAQKFIEEMKHMVWTLIYEVKNDSSQTIEIESDIAKELKQSKKKVSNKTSSSENNFEFTCPLCKKEKLVKGKTAFGCLGFKNGCNFKVPFKLYGKKITDKQFVKLFSKGSTDSLKGFDVDGKKIDGRIILKDDSSVELQPAEKKKDHSRDPYNCPICKQGVMLKGKNAYGCSRYSEGCKFTISFSHITEKYGKEELSPEIINEEGKIYNKSK